MRILICGVGSIGERHIGNLLQLGHEDLAVYRTRNLPMRTLGRSFPTYSDLDQALDEFRPEVAFITNPTAFHMPVALACARRGCHLFIEKPLSHNLDGVDALQDELDRHGRHAMVGYMLRFHPLFQKVKTWLDEGPDGTLGIPVLIRASWGEHVPDWHPWEDYRESYAVRPDLGGGPALTLSHEMDLLAWMLGTPVQTLAMTSRSSPLEATCDHTVEFLLRFAQGAVGNLHLDYCQRPPHRSWELVGSNGRVNVDCLAGALVLWRGRIGEIPAPEGPKQPLGEVHSVEPGFDRNDMFTAELKYFLECIAGDRPPAPGVSEAAETVRIALRAVNGGLL